MGRCAIIIEEIIYERERAMPPEQYDKRIAHGNHNGNDGYIYRFCTSDSGEYSSHIHGCYEFIYITEGCCIYTIEGRDYFVMSGDMIFTRPGELHSFTFPDECTFSRHFLHVYPDFIAKVTGLTEAFYVGENIDKCFISSDIVEKYDLNKIFDTLIRYSDYEKPETSIIAYSCAVEIMAKIMMIMREEDMQRQTVAKNANTYKIMQYIDAHFGENISLDDIAGNIRLSKFHISHMFKKDVGMTISTYINMIRITKAKNLILKGQNSGTVFHKCGFNDYSSFYRSFVKFVGMSPDSFKKGIKR